MSFGINSSELSSPLIFSITYSTILWVVTISSLTSDTLIPAFFLPREHEESHLLDDEDTPKAPVFVH